MTELPVDIESGNLLPGAKMDDYPKPPVLVFPAKFWYNAHDILDINCISGEFPIYDSRVALEVFAVKKRS